MDARELNRTLGRWQIGDVDLNIIRKREWLCSSLINIYLKAVSDDLDATGTTTAFFFGSWMGPTVEKNKHSLNRHPVDELIKDAVRFYGWICLISD